MKLNPTVKRKMNETYLSKIYCDRFGYINLIPVFKFVKSFVKIAMNFWWYKRIKESVYKKKRFIAMCIHIYIYIYIFFARQLTQTANAMLTYAYMIISWYIYIYIYIYILYMCVCVCVCVCVFTNLLSNSIHGYQEKEKKTPEFRDNNILDHCLVFG